MRSLSQLHPFFSNLLSIPNRCALTSKQNIECWGDNDDGQSRVGSTPAAFVSVSSGGFHTCGLATSNDIMCIGDNEEGQAPESWTATSGIFESVSAGYFHTCAASSSGAVECLGWNDAGQAPTSPVTSSDGSDFISVGCGRKHSCAVNANGGVECKPYQTNLRHLCIQLYASTYIERRS